MRRRELSSIRSITASMLGSILFCIPMRAQQQAEADRLFGSAMMAQQRGDLPSAIKDYRKVLQISPKLVDAQVNLGAALAQTGQFDEAIKQYRLALTAIPENADLRRNLGLAYYKKGEPANAAREFEAVHKRRPGDMSLTILLADSEVRSGRAMDARAMLTPMEAENAGNPDFEYVMGTALLATGERREAVARLEKVAEATRGADVYLLAGSTLLDLNSAAGARKDLEMALKLDPQLKDIYTLVGKARDHTGDQVEAEKAFREAVRVNPADFEANLYLGAILYKKREMGESKRFMDKAVALNPESAMARYEMGMWKSTSGDYTSALVELEQVVKQDPDWLEPHVELATVYYRLHRPDDGAKQREIVAKLTAEQQARGPGK